MRPAPKSSRSACPASAAIDVLHGRWKVVILYHLAARTMRFSELQRTIGVSQKVLIQQLRELEGDGIVQRIVYPVVPPKVEYSLTRSGRTLLPIVEAMCRWSSKRR